MAVLDTYKLILTQNNGAYWGPGYESIKTNWPLCRLRLLNTLTAPLQRGKTPRPPFGRGSQSMMLKHGILVVEQYLVRQPSRQATYNTSLWPSLGLTGGRTDPIRSVCWSFQAIVATCFIPTVLFNLQLQKIPNPYLLRARRRWLSVSYVERIGMWPMLKT